jgi:O-antigen ligase
MWYRRLPVPQRPMRSSLLSARSDMARLSPSSAFALLGICIYLAGLVLPLPSYLPLIGLALMGVLAVLFGASRRTLAWSPLTIAVLAFLASVGVSTLVSEDIGRSLRLSAALLPGILMFVLITDYFDGVQQIRLLYLTCSVVALALALVVLWAAAWHGHAGAGLERLLSPSLGPAILVVRNDITFLAVLAPLSLALCYREPLRIGIITAASIVLSLGAICISTSRTAALTLVLGLIATIVLVQPRQRLFRNLVGGLALLCAALLANALVFPESQVLTKLALNWTLSGRTDLWSTAWAMFQDAPLLGKGPHAFGVFHRIPWAHNLYLEVMAEQGLLGLVALGGLLACGIVTGWKVAHSPVENARYLGVGAVASLIGMCGAGVVELSLVREWVVITLFLLLGIIARLVLAAEAASSTESPKR